MPAICQMKVDGLFLDYDGTISPINVPREQSRVIPQIESALYQIRQLVPVGVITTKDLAFILPKTPFAHAWATVVGLEMKIGESIVKAPGLAPALTRLRLALRYAKQHLGDDIIIEEKRDATGHTIAFCVDWRHIKKAVAVKSKVAQVMTCSEALRLEVIKYEGQPFFDVYPCPVDKGKALTELKGSFGLKSGVMYMGDSKVDNPAFKVADIGIGVLYGESPSELDCDYYVKLEDVTNLLQHLLENNLVFSPTFPEIEKR